ncbi:MAG: sigma-70 family RNA polymerase sigma factor [Planctomycetota bacterium]
MSEDLAAAEPLIDRLKRGDSTALGPLFGIWRPRLWRMVHFRLDPRLQGRVDADDILQEAFLDAEKRLSSWDPELGPFHVWLRMVVQQTMVDVHRRHLGAKMRRADQEQRLPAWSGSVGSFFVGRMTSPSQAAMREELKLCVERALDAMDEIDREVLILRHFEELTNKEVAEVLAISENAASNRYVRALARLRGHLSELGDEP